MKPLVIDLFAGCFGWSAGFLAEGWRAVGFDIAHEPHHGPVPDGAELVIQDVLTLHGSQFKDAAAIVASPPCQKYSYMAMPWSRSKAMIKHYQESEERRAELNTLFDSCFRIQREACEAANRILDQDYRCDAWVGCPRLATVLGHFGRRCCSECFTHQWKEYGPVRDNRSLEFGYRHIPMVVENVKGAEKWVGHARWHFGSFYLWGDVPAVMPFTKARKQKGRNFHFPEKYGIPSPSFHGADHEPRVREAMALKTTGHANKRDGHTHTRHLTNQSESDGLKFGGGWWHDSTNNLIQKASSRSTARKAASAQIAKIPLALSTWIARCYTP